MKILYVIGMFYPSQAGGPSSAISWLVKYIHSKGMETKVVTTCYGIKDDNIKPDTWIRNEFGDVCYHSFYSMKFPIRMTISAIRELKNVDVVHLNSIFHPPCLTVAFFALLWKKTIFWDPGGELAKEALRFGHVKKRVYLRLFRAIVGNKPYYHTTSDKEALDVKKHLSKNAHLFEAPNYIEKIEKLEVPIKKQFLFMGRLHPIKGIDNLIKAVSKSEKFLTSDYTLIIAGSGEEEYTSILKKLVSELNIGLKVRFTGHIAGREKFLLYAESYFLVLPSHSENFANVVTESLSQGTPVIASEGTPWKCLEENHAGFHCSNDPATLAEIINQAIQLVQEDYQEYRERAHNLLINHFDMHKCGHRWVTAYKNALNHSDYHQT